MENKLDNEGKIRDYFRKNRITLKEYLEHSLKNPIEEHYGRFDQIPIL